MKHLIKTAGTIFVFFLLLFTVNQNSFAEQSPLTNILNPGNTLIESIETTDGLFISDIYCDQGKLSVVVENGGESLIDPEHHGGLHIWIDGTLEWTYSWSTWSCQDFRSPGGHCVIQPQILNDGEHMIEVSLLDENNDEIDFMTRVVKCGEESTDPDPGLDPDPTDTPADCVMAEDIFDTETSDMTEVVLGDVFITPGALADGTPVNLNITNCTNEGNALNIFVPWSEDTASEFAAIHFTETICPQGFPQRVEVLLQHGNYAELIALNSDGTVVDTTSAADHSSVQVLTLTNADGIAKIEIVGSEICILKICWECRDQGVNDDPECPPEVIDAAYEAGYQAGLAAAAANADNNTAEDQADSNGMCSSYNFLTGILSVPCLDFNGFTEERFWIELQLLNSEDWTFQIVNSGVNTP